MQKSGDLCRLLGNYQVEHYRCDDYRDGTVTEVINGTVVKRPKFDAPMGFARTLAEAESEAVS